MGRDNFSIGAVRLDDVELEGNEAEDVDREDTIDVDRSWYRTS